MKPSWNKSFDVSKSTTENRDVCRLLGRWVSISGVKAARQQGIAPDSTAARLQDRKTATQQDGRKKSTLKRRVVSLLLVERTHRDIGVGLSTVSSKAGTNTSKASNTLGADTLN